MLAIGSATPLRVLVTGGAGFIGGHLVQRLLVDGHHITILDDLSTSPTTSLPVSERLTFVQGSILEPADIAAAASGCEMVMHLASVVGKQLVAEDPQFAFRVSDEGTYNVLEGTRGMPIVLFSSSAVYGVTDHGASSEVQQVSEKETLDYDNGEPGYATGKLRVELMGKAAAAAGRSVAIVRPFNVVGPGQTGSYGMVLPRFVRSALRGTPLRVYGDGNQTRSFTQVNTFIDCLMSLLSRPAAWLAPDNVVNMGVSKPTSIRQLAALVLEETQSRSKVEYIPYDDIFPGEVDVRARVPAIERLVGLIGPVQWPSTRAIVRGVVASIQAESGNVHGDIAGGAPRSR